MESKVEHPRPQGMRRMDGLMVFFEAGREIISSYDSDNNCSGAGLIAHIERCRQSDATAKQTERAEAKAELRRQEAADKAALGDVFGALATLIRQRRAEASRPAKQPAVLKRHKRRRRLKA